MQQSDFLKKVQSDLSLALNEFFPIAKLSPRSLLVVGCSTSEVLGEKIGTHGSEETADVIFRTLYDFCREHSLFLAAQCCEHLNRALILDKSSCDAQLSANRVNVVPMPHAGGSFAAAAYRSFAEPCAVEHIRADAGIDIGDTFIGMHLKEVAVPVRVSVSSIGSAHLTLARARLRYIGGPRAVYDETLL